MAPLFKYPAAAAQPAGPSPPPLPDSFATRLQRSGSPLGNVEDRRPRRPGVIPGQYGADLGGRGGGDARGTASTGPRSGNRACA
jgi:hypothetical protein